MQGGHRPEIQALRAVAVALVVVYHHAPAAVPGGFVGVDVFFAISGFLITGQLVREAQRSGRVSLAGFWARRARRILPAALVVLAACAAVTVVVVPVTAWPPFLTEIRASALYVENLHLAGAAVDYLAADDPPSPVRHFWSLSAEEQFYLAWPLLIGGALLAARRRRASATRAIAAVLGAVTLLSLVCSIVLTARAPSTAFFVTPTRAWEFGVGGLLALAPLATARPALRAVVALAGLAAIAVAAGAYSDATPFPGVAAALPVLGAAAVMWAGAPRVSWSPAPLMRARPVQALGDISYSVYLWHWPLLVFAPFVLDEDPDTATRVVLVALTLLLGTASKAWIEDPARSGRVLTGRPARWTFAAAAAGTLAVVGAAGIGAGEVADRARDDRAAARRVLDRPPPCFGAAARDPRRPCPAGRVPSGVVPTPVAARRARNDPCTRVERRGPIFVCAFGVPRAQATATIALIGDSHASHWRAAVDAVAEARGWRGLSVARTSCPYSTARRIMPEPDRSSCEDWRREVRRWLGRHPEIRTVFVSQLARAPIETAPAEDPHAAAVDGYAQAWEAMPDTVERIVVLRDTPHMRGLGRTLDCVQERLQDGARTFGRCDVPRTAAVVSDAAVEAAERDPRADVVDLTRHFCDRRRCFAVVGGVLTHKDTTHMTLAFATTLGPYLLRAVDRLLPERATRVSVFPP